MDTEIVCAAIRARSLTVLAMSFAECVFEGEDRKAADGVLPGTAGRGEARLLPVYGIRLSAKSYHQSVGKLTAGASGFTPGKLWIGDF